LHPPVKDFGGDSPAPANVHLPARLNRTAKTGLAVKFEIFMTIVTIAFFRRESGYGLAYVTSFPETPEPES